MHSLNPLLRLTTELPHRRKTGVFASESMPILGLPALTTCSSLATRAPATTDSPALGNLLNVPFAGAEYVSGSAVSGLDNIRLVVVARDVFKLSTGASVLPRRISPSLLALTLGPARRGFDVSLVSEVELAQRRKRGLLLGRSALALDAEIDVVGAFTPV